MVKKKSRDPKKSSESSKGSLADQLKKLELDVEPGEQAPQKPARPSASATAPSKPQPSARLEPEAAPLGEEDLFRQAMENISKAELFQAKYEGIVKSVPPAPAQTAQPEPADEFDEEAAREWIEGRRDKVIFERAVGKVEPIPDKYHRPSPPGPKELFVSRAEEGGRATFITPLLPKSGKGLHEVPPLNAAQRAMQKRFNKFGIANEPRELNVRGDNLADALRQLELFIHQAWKERAIFVRIIHGRGLQSQDMPVLKPAILEWLETSGQRYVRGYIPDVQSGGDYGSLIVELASVPGRG